jgi:glyoxylase-like metal-dependent hydrolase (beta-lactamase superfamily II)
MRGVSRGLSIAVAVAAFAIPAMPEASLAGKHMPEKSGAQLAIGNPGCESLSAKECIKQALDAMGGRERLEAIHTIRLDVIGHTALAEQSYRQAPFYSSYERDQIVIDYAGQRYWEKQHAVWPEADLQGADSDSMLIVTPGGGVNRFGKQEAPCGGGDLDASSQEYALGATRVLLTAASAADLRYAKAETVRGTPHAALAFTWKGVPVHVLLNRYNHLPDAVETTQQFRDFWYYWGDVSQRVYFDNWRWVHGVEYPSSQITERNGLEWNSIQALDIEFNVPLDEKEFAVDAKMAAASLQSKGWNRSFNGKSKELAAGVDLYLGSWNTTIVKQSDGVVILETPISETYTKGILEEAKRLYPNQPVKAVLTTSDSWPHTGGVRYAVAEGLPVYLLDLNRPLLDRMVAAKHGIAPDALATHAMSPKWHVVSDKTEIGSGENRMVLYPLRGASTERQYMVYFPAHHLLYASDTLVMNADKSLYDPELMHEVEAAVRRENLDVDTVFAMHQAPVPWGDVVTALEKSRA